MGGKKGAEHHRHHCVFKGIAVLCMVNDLVCERGPMA